MKTRLLAVLVVAGMGCRDLSWREPEAQNVGPRVAFDRIEPEAALPLRPQLALTAEDADGVGAVGLECGAAEGGAFSPLISWGGPPYAAPLDLTGCVAGLPAESGGEVVRIVLAATATDALGASTRVELPVRVAISSPELGVQAPARVRPGSEVTVQITAGSSVAGLPFATLDGAPLPVTAGAIAGQYTATFTAGTIGPPPETGAPSLEALEEIERPVTVKVSAIGGEGNRTDVTRQIFISRIAWERGVPATLTDTAERAPHLPPYAGPDGLWVALAPENPENPWRPGFFDAASGAFVAPPTGGFTGLNFAADGSAIVEDLQRNAPLTATLLPNGQLDSVTGALPDGPVVRFADRTCVATDSRSTTDTICGSWTGPLRCFGPGASFTSSTSPTFTTLSGAGGVPQHFASSGGNAVGLSLEGPIPPCPLTPDTTTILWSTAAATSADGQLPGTPREIHRLMPVGETGTFLVVFTDAAGSLHAGRIENGLYSELFPSLPHPSMLTALPNGQMVAIQPGATSTELTTFDTAATGQTPSGTIPLPVEYVTGTDTVIPHNVVAMPDGRVAFLARGNDFGRMVVATDAALRPRWIYRYPRGTANAHLVAGGGRLYLVDVQNSHVVALFGEW